MPQTPFTYDQILGALFQKNLYLSFLRFHTDSQYDHCNGRGTPAPQYRTHCLFSR